MQMPFITGVRAIVFGAACLAAQVTLAADALVAGSHTLSGLNYRLIDLDVSDGITPYITFKSDGSTSLAVFPAFFEPGGQTLRGAAGPFLGGDLTLSTPSGTSNASVSSTTVHTENALNLGDETKLIPSRNGTSAQLERNATVSSRMKFELSANTQLVLEGMVNNSAKVDLAALVGSPLLFTPVKRYGSISGNAHSIISATIIGSTEPRFQSRVDAAQQVTASGVHPKITSGLTYVSEDSEVLPFLLTYSNHADNAVLQTFAIDVTSRATMTATVIPEASTVAYALCGMSGVLWFTARRRQREGVKGKSC